MLRSMLPLALLAIACNPAEGRDHQSLFVTMSPLEGGGAASAFAVGVSVDETARTYDNSVEITIGGAFVEGEALDMSLSVLEGLTEAASGHRTSANDAEDAVWSPDFEACEGDAYVIRDDGGCTYAVAALLLGDRSYSVIMGFLIVSQAPKDLRGNDVVVTIEAEEIQSE